MRVLAAVASLMLLVITLPESNGEVDLSIEAIKRLEYRLSRLEGEHKAYQDVISSLVRQISMQQFYVEEVSRSSGDSGIKQSRLTHTGTRSYHTTSFSDLKIAAIHDHSNYRTTLGMGEVIAVLNGVEFRTRHNDYKLNQPSTKTRGFGRTEPIEFPPVPPEVLAQPTVEKQGEELRQWFKAFKNQDYSKRDYRKYFKPVLCYMEGMWTESTKGKMTEPFESDRHKIDADSFHDLQDLAAFTSATGRKHISENYAFLPTTVSRITKDGRPVYSQWNYDILCHKLKQDVPLHRFKQEDDLGVRVARTKTFVKAKNERFQRFSLWPKMAGPRSQFRHSTEGYTLLTTGSFLDSLMAEIPGKDNYMGKITDDAFNETALDPFYRPPKGEEGRPRNVAYYHKLYRTKTRDAMGSEIRHRSFSDASLYLSYNTRPNITPNDIKWCRPNRSCAAWRAKKGECEMKICSSWRHRVSYAIPLEIIYINPLQSWNPYNLTMHSNKNFPETWKTEGKYKRTGAHNEKMAVYGNSKTFFYRTPYSFFNGDNEVRDQADTTRLAMSVFDPTGKIRRTRASGIHIMTPKIEGVGVVRQRYPIMPVHQAGSFVFKEIDALKDVTLEAGVYKRFYRNKVVRNGTLEEVFTFDIAMGDAGGQGPHHHTVDITESELREMKSGKAVTVLSSANSGHDHEITLEYRATKYPTKTIEHLFMMKCDGQKWQCFDGHKGWSICSECPDRFPDLDDF